MPFQGNFNTRVYDKRDDFSFPIVNFPFMEGGVPLAPSVKMYKDKEVKNVFVNV